VEELVKALTIGVTNGLIIALIAIGYTLVYGILELINFAHADVFMLGTAFTYFATELIVRGTTPGGAASLVAASRARRPHALGALHSLRAPLACAAQRPHARPHAGSVKRKVVPSPSRLSTTTWPPCASTMPRTIASPSPTPRCAPRSACQ